MTELLYYEQPYQQEFSARILRREAAEKGPAVLLDRTLFYPEGGGQPSDIGELAGVGVLNVKKRDGEVWHYLDGEPQTEDPSAEVRGQINWHRRYDYMQQHTGQHILSAVMYRSYGYQTVSVHQGSDYLTIEVEADDLSPRQIEGFEDEAADLIARNLPVNIFWVGEEETAEYDLRRRPKVGGTIRIVQIDDFDAVACGGVHTATTGEVKLVKHIYTERIRGRQRLYWKIGDRALQDYRRRTEVTADLSDLLSVPLEGITERARATVEELTSLRQENAALEQRAAALEAGRLVRQAEPAGELRLAFGEFHGEGKEFLRRLADAVKEEEKLLLAAVNHGEKGMQWVIAAGPETGFDFNTYRHDLLKPIAGKGGGKAPVWQGVGENPAGISEFRRLIREKAAGGE